MAEFAKERRGEMMPLDRIRWPPEHNARTWRTHGTNSAAHADEAEFSGGGDGHEGRTEAACAEGKGESG